MILHLVTSRRRLRPAGDEPARASALEALYLYMLKNGRPPEEGAWGKLSFVWWWGTQKFRTVGADRIRLLQIFSRLSRALETKASCE